jgi:Xaa-Pro aminopeptidase
MQKSGFIDIIILFSGYSPIRTQDLCYKYQTNKNFYYFTGIANEGNILLMYKLAENIVDILFVEEADDINEMTRKFAYVRRVSEFIECMNLLLNKYSKTNLNVGLDFYKAIHSKYDCPINLFSKLISEKWGYININNISPIIADMRIIKSKEETLIIKNAIEITRNGHERVVKSLHPGLYEYQVSAEFEYQICYDGADGIAFETVIAAGANALQVHYANKNKQIKSGDLVLVDCGAQYQQYVADVTRTYPASGKFTEKQKLFYNIVLRTRENVINAIKPGVQINKLNNICQQSLFEELNKIGLITEFDEVKNFFCHEVSHYLGLDVHDVGDRNMPLVPGVIIAVEPGIYIEEMGIGIRIEDNILVTDTGCEILTRDIILSIEDIEQFMKSNMKK